MSVESRRQSTWRRELARAGAAGVLETAGNTFLLLIALRWFGAGATAKALVASSMSVGLIASPLLVSWVTARGWPVARAASGVLAAGAAAFFVTALVPWLPVYVAGTMLGMAATGAVIPLLTEMFQQNYPAHERGRLFSRTVMIRIAAAAAFSHLAGVFLTDHFERFRWLLLGFAAAAAWSAWCLRGCPTQPLAPDGGSHPLRALRYVREDDVFRRTLIAWMLMGVANLVMLPLRIEYLAGEKYGLLMSAATIALVTGVVPNLARLVMSPVWGWLFDHINFFTLRVTLNLGFALGILAFFTSNSLPGLLVGAVIYGISNAGGDVAWSLWVTKFAPPGRVADYMSVHTFFTGLRGVAAPFLAFYAVQYLSLGVMGGICAAMIVAASLFLLPEVRAARRAKAGAALNEEVSD
ncbi:MAG: MFS transporter [Limisphaerales bacterium]